MRITRLLSHMNVVGFRQYALQLLTFLNKEILGVDGGLKALKQLPVVKEWNKFGEVEKEVGQEAN